jgi:hypothetical protein
MPGTVRPFSSGTVRLRRHVLEPVQRLAHLAGMSVQDVVELVLLEVLQGEETGPAREAATEHRYSKPAKVIPILRARAEQLPARLAWLRSVDLRGLRRKAAEARDHAKTVRQRAERVCRSAVEARTAASRLLGTRWE